MTVKQIFIIAIAFLFFVEKQSYAQEKVIFGRITTFDSIPVMNASIKVYSTKQIVFSDSLGNFSVACNNIDKVKVKANGFNSQKVKLTPLIKFAAINLKLKQGEKNREYAIGYGHVTDRDKLNAVSNLNNKDFDFSNYTNMYDLILGRFASVQIVNNEIIIRGENSINSSSAALIVVDGIASDNSVLNSLSPHQVKSISIIKDGSSAIYGSRGAYGVV
ncbi:MAG: TonB-dependent receptor plug domain-containing protein, partial [Draconibacterium sp.]|nr:TonB-dependent receptor plug domain-containing protein [Draconibacterium sp.]